MLISMAQTQATAVAAARMLAFKGSSSRVPLITPSFAITSGDRYSDERKAREMRGRNVLITSNDKKSQYNRTNEGKATTLILQSQGSR